MFINYRSGDEPYAAALIDRELSGRFGPTSVFRASRSIRPGEDFANELLDNVRQATVLLVVVGGRWNIYQSRIDANESTDETDWVRREIAEAIDNGVRVIPVLVGDTAMPSANDLPDNIRPLTRYQYLRLHHRTISPDMTHLTNELLDLAPDLAHRHRHT